MANKGLWKNQHLVYTDGYEYTGAQFPIQFNEDFLGYKLQKYVTGENTTPLWCTIENVGTLTTAPTILDDAYNGICVMALAATDEAERGVLYFGDNLCFNINCGLIFETRLALSVLTTTGTEKAQAIWGLASADNATSDSVATALWFKTEGDANVYWESDDTSTNDDDNDTGIDMVAETFHVFRIDCTVATAPKFYVDNVDVTTTATQTTACAMAATTATTARVQPYFAVQKQKSSANTGVGSMWIDYVRIWQNRS